MDYQFWIPLAVLSAAMLFCERKWCLLRDLTKPAPHQPYSWSRVQLAWWTVIVLSSFIAIIWKGYYDADGVLIHAAPELHHSAVILLGISSLTTITARTMDATVPDTGQGSDGENFFLDILSDHNGVSIARFQTVLFNLVFGIWFISQVAAKLAATDRKLNDILPVIDDNNLVLLGLSSAAYTAMKLTENKEKEKQAATESASTGAPVGDVVEELEPAVG